MSKNLRGTYKQNPRLYVLPDGRPIQQAVTAALDSGYNYYATRPLSTDLKGLDRRIEARLRMKNLGLAPWAQKNKTNIPGAKNVLEYVYRILMDAMVSEHAKHSKREAALRGNVIVQLSNGVTKRFSNSVEGNGWASRRLKGKPGMRAEFFHAPMAYATKPGKYEFGSGQPFSALEANEYGNVTHAGIFK